MKLEHKVKAMHLKITVFLNMLAFKDIKRQPTEVQSRI